MKTFLLLVLALGPICGLAAESEFADARVLDVQARQGTSNAPVLGNRIQADNFTEITVQLGEMKVTARSFEYGGGVIYISQHPEAFVVGTDVKARLAGHGILELLVDGKKKLKFDIQRLEKVALK